MEFEFDPNKSRKNKEKHDIDFVEAQLLWEDPDRIEIPVVTEDEPRAIMIAKIKGKPWSAIITTRSDKTRIISVRRSRKKEIEIYEG
jgi:uncharacterized DUF497 family protein